MLALVLAAIILLFLTTGAIVFSICVLIPPLRRYALSAALWCATWGPASVAFLLLAGTAVFAHASISIDRDVEWFHAPRLVPALGWIYLAVSVIITIAAASLLAWLHQKLMHRMTFPLFRVYTTVVCAGIGSVFGWCLGWLLMWREIDHAFLLWILGMLILTVGFGTASYKGARSLRGEPPEKFTWITAEEFNGT
jgi:hypothetical protein